MEEAPDPEVAARVEAERSGPPIVVASVLSDPHPLVARTAKELAKAKPHSGLVSVAKDGVLDVVVAPESRDRAMRIVDAVVKAFEERQLEVDVARQPRADTFVTRVKASDHWICWRVFERTRSEPGPAPKPARYTVAPWLERKPDLVWIPAGHLALEITTSNGLGTRRTWQDGKVQRVERCLNQFIAEVIALGDVLVRKDAERKRADEQHAAKQREQRAAQERAAVEAENERRLLDAVGRWRRVRDIRRYVADLRALGASLGQPMSPTSELAHSIAWALEYADRIDPIERTENGSTRCWSIAERTRRVGLLLALAAAL